MPEIEDLELVLAAWKAGDYESVVARGSAVIESGADASTIVMLYGDALAKLGRTSDARDAFKLALTILPVARHRLILGALAALELHADRYEAAEGYCQRAIALAPDHASAYIYLGVSYESIDRISDAELQFTRATACTEGALDEAWYNLGRVQQGLGRTIEATTSYRRAIAIDAGYELALQALVALETNRHGAIEA
jgi:tetratricopeptide (TPR) repeat protein